MAEGHNGGRTAKYLLAILVPVLIMTGVFFWLTSRTVSDLAMQGIVQRSEDNAYKVNAYLEDVVNSMEDIRELCELNCDTDEEVADFIRSSENYGTFGGAYTGDNTGFYVGSTPWDVPADYDPTTRPWYIDGKDSRDFVFGDPYNDASDDEGVRMCVSVSARMDAGDDAIVRVIAADIYLDYMDALVENLVSGSDLEGALLVTGDGVIVADSTGQYAGEVLAETSEFNAIYAVGVLLQEGGGYEMSDGSTTYFMAVTDVPVTGWRLLVYESEDTVLHDLRVTEAIMGVAALCVVTFLLFVMRRYGREVSEVEQQANKAKTEFISRISHDIRTPIGQVLNLTEFAKADKDDPAKLDEDLDRIDSSGRFLLSLINDVLDVSQIESGLMEMHPEASTYADYMADIRNIMIPMCEEKGLTCSIVDGEDDASLPAMYCDAVRLKQITLNLISNAVKYTPAGGSVTYTSTTRAGADGGLSFGFVLSDTGVGMTPEFMEHMFERFTRDTQNELRDSTQMGSGLGLYLVKNMVELMGGTIEFQSEKGKGTSVEVHLDLPAAPVDEATGATDGAGDVGTDGEDGAGEKRRFEGHVLLVEDNELNTLIATRMLEELGLTLDHAADGQEAVDMFAASAPGAYRMVFMDIQMPRMNGYEATRAIRALERDDAREIPIVAMTADAFKDAMDESREAGMTGFITKPLDLEKICELLG